MTHLTVIPHLERLRGRLVSYRVVIMGKGLIWDKACVSMVKEHGEAIFYMV
ncbi:hypothetical protein ES703_19586 [subsurface metagenome]